MSQRNSQAPENPGQASFSQQQRGEELHFLIPQYHPGLPLNLISQVHVAQQNQTSRHELLYGFKSAVTRFTFSL